MEELVVMIFHIYAGKYQYLHDFPYRIPLGRYRLMRELYRLTQEMRVMRKAYDYWI